MLGRCGSLRARDRLGHRCGLRDGSGRHVLLRSGRRGLLTTVGFARGTRPGHLGRTIGRCRLARLTGTVHDRPRRLPRNRSRSGHRSGFGGSHLAGVRIDGRVSGVTPDAGVLGGSTRLRLGGGLLVSGGAAHAGRVAFNRRALRGSALLRLGGGRLVSGGAGAHTSLLDRNRRALHGLGRGHLLTIRADARTSRFTSNPGLSGGHLLTGRADAHPSGVTRSHRTLRGDGLFRLAGSHLVTGGLTRRRRTLRGLLGVGGLRGLARRRRIRRGLRGVGTLRGPGRGRRCRVGRFRGRHRHVGRFRGDAGCDGLGRARRLC
ncbi:hypothetical protein [Streptomyces swartbergensis]|uniref:hypothetical protein n=1 Tax=Streptomyces swartbergensis TaxID=487165 RepID=UPI00117C7A97|nr:hypothetical protein [Streptomyces swartbergensis]